MISARILKAANFAAVKHGYQLRKGSGLPYIIHPIGVANLLSDAGVEDVDVLQAALLHDVVEDTNTKLDEIEKEFGVSVSSIVAEVTDDKKKSKVDRKKLQIEHAAHVSTQAKLVKLADKL
jgi:(p)ppGpp synthase/HD superfamily hydrolase